MNAEQIASLLKLPCFTGQDCSVIALSGSGNNPCCKVIGHQNSKVYFAKYLGLSSHIDAGEVAIEQQGLTAAQFLTTVNSHLASFTPRIVYQDRHWQVQAFIDGVNLQDANLTLPEKIAAAVTTMARMHQATPHPAPLLADLDLFATLSPLIQQLTLKEQYKARLQHRARRLCADVNGLNAGIEQTVFTHGDINFANIIIDSDDKPWFVDLEFLCLAPREYDLAMFLAINHLFSADDHRTRAINDYETHCGHSIHRELLTAYIPLCLLLNGLWYAIQSYDKSEFYPQAQHQINAFDALCDEQISSYLFTN